jgi:hypothetical protein
MILFGMAQGNRVHPYGRKIFRPSYAAAYRFFAETMIRANSNEGKRRAELGLGVPGRDQGNAKSTCDRPGACWQGQRM